MPRGISVHVGVNISDPVFGVTALQGCVFDAIAMRDIADVKGFETRIFLDDEATFDNVSAAILDAANRLHAGDIFLFTFAGHGSFQSTLALHEEDGQDETILLRDCVLIDNYLRRNLWSEFEAGVRILGIADSCHSGSVLTASTMGSSSGVLGFNVPLAGVGAPVFEGSPVFEMVIGGAGSADFQPSTQPIAAGPGQPPQRVPSPKGNRGFTNDDRERIVSSRRDIHERLRNELNSGEAAKVNASLLTLAACRDNEEALDGPEHGAFTQALLEVWNEGTFSGHYDDFIGQISARFPALGRQHPIRLPRVVDNSFLQQRPFTIGS